MHGDEFPHSPLPSGGHLMPKRFKPSSQWLLVFIPITLVLEHLGGIQDPVIFFSAALGIIPIAALIVRSTEHLAHYTGDAVGGLLNATFGNAPELIITFVALNAGLTEMVRASLVGAVLANLLLTLGMSFFMGGIRYHDQEYNPAAARVYSSMMMLASFALLVPSAFHGFFKTAEPLIEERQLDVGVAIILLAAYGLNLFFMLKTHPEVFKSTSKAGEDETHGHWSIIRAVLTLFGASVGAAWMSEILVGAAEGTGEALGMSDVFIGMILLAVIGGAAESGSAIAMARKNKMDLSLSIAMGSCVQITLFIAPVLVLMSYVTAPEPLYLEFSRAETGILFLGVLIATVVAGDGRSNWYKGVQLITVYLIIAVSLYLIPS